MAKKPYEKPTLTRRTIDKAPVAAAEAEVSERDRQLAEMAYMEVNPEALANGIEYMTLGPAKGGNEAYTRLVQGYLWWVANQARVEHKAAGLNPALSDILTRMRPAPAPELPVNRVADEVAAEAEAEAAPRVRARPTTE